MTFSEHDKLLWEKKNCWYMDSALNKINIGHIYDLK